MSRANGRRKKSRPITRWRLRCRDTFATVGEGWSGREDDDLEVIELTSDRTGQVTTEHDQRIRFMNDQRPPSLSRALYPREP